MDRFLVAPLLGTTVLLCACAGVSRLDLGSIASRDGWQRPTDVVEALAIAPGARVADLGAGDGYFVPFLADAVGPDGRVYAIDVDPEVLQRLSDRVAREALDPVIVVEGAPDHSGLGAQAVDRVLIVNTFHHIDDPVAYFRRLRDALAPDARVAILEPDEELTGVLSWFLDEGHTSRAADVRALMQQAGYRHLESHEFLPIQVFEVFEVLGVDPG